MTTETSTGSDSTYERMTDNGYLNDEHFQRRSIDELPTDMIKDIKLVVIDKRNDVNILGSMRDKFIK